VTGGRERPEGRAAVLRIRRALDLAALCQPLEHVRHRHERHAQLFGELRRRRRAEPCEQRHCRELRAVDARRLELTRDEALRPVGRAPEIEKEISSSGHRNNHDFVIL
jgi:hypothetical protein